jgi:Uma2 family endonuclease
MLSAINRELARQYLQPQFRCAGCTQNNAWYSNAMSEPSALSALPRMTVEEFVLWSEQQPSGKYELEDGYVVVKRLPWGQTAPTFVDTTPALQSERAPHTRAKFAAAIALKEAIGTAGVPCEAFPEGLTVKISDQRGYEPDAIVNCGEKLGNELIALNPIIVVEVLSPSTASKDMGVKVRDYFTVPSIQHYLIVDLDRRVVVHHRRTTGTELLTSFYSSGQIRLDPPGITVDAETMFG